MTAALLPAALVLLAGCASLGDAPPAQPPAPAVATAWQTELPHRGQASELAQWWAQFQDPLLSRLIDAAQRVSPTLASAASRIEQARAAAVAAGAARQPSLDAVGQASRSRNDPTLPATRVASVGLQAAWEIDLFGAVKAGADAGQSRLAGAQSAWHAARVSVAAELATTYLAYRACEAQARELAVDVDSRAETARVTERSAQAGLSAPAAAAQARASAAQGRAQLVAQRTQCDSLVKALVLLTGEDEAALRAALAARSGQVPEAAPIAFTALPAALLAQRPDLAEAAHAVSAAAADVRVADARRLPRVALSGSLGLVAVSSAGTRLDDSTWSLGPLQVSFPLFDGGSRRAQAQAARAAYDEAVVQYQARLRTAVKEVEDALLQLRSSEQRRADLQGAADGYEASFKAAEARQRGGVASIFELEDARRTAVAARSALVEWQRERTAAWISLYRALGGGWQAPRAEPASASAAN